MVKMRGSWPVQPFFILYLLAILAEHLLEYHYGIFVLCTYNRDAKL